MFNTARHLADLGGVLSNDATVAKDVHNIKRLTRASSSVGLLQKSVWKNHSLRLSETILVYRAAVVNSLLYGSEEWVLYKKQVQLLQRFHQ